jgi:hypothetical protein
MEPANVPFARDTFSTGMTTSYCTVCRRLVVATFNDEILRRAEQKHCGQEPHTACCDEPSRADEQDVA